MKDFFTDDFYKETEEYRKALQAKLDDAIKSEDNKKDIKTKYFPK